VPSTISGIPYPLSTDPPNGASQMQSLAAAVETIFAGGGSAVSAYNSVPSFTSTAAYATYVTATLAIPSYWTGYRVIAFAGGQVGNDQMSRILINAVTATNTNNMFASGNFFALGSATGTATGSIAVALQISGANGGSLPGTALHLAALAFRTS
jgi:hypothetical protein